MATINSVGVGLSGATGTGSFVGSTSATLVTPALGTPSSGVLTNCTGLVVGGGGTGAASFTAYAVLCGGTTSTSALQSIAGVGTSGQILTSNGAGALPTFQNATSGSGTVNSGTANDIAYYAGTGTAVSGLTLGNNKMLATNGSGVPSGTTFINSTTFTPTVTLVGGTGNTVPQYTTNRGIYNQIGNIVFVQVFLSGATGNAGAGTGRMNIALPVTAASTTYMSSTYINAGTFMNAAINIMFAQVTSGATTVQLYTETAVNTIADFTGSLQNNTAREVCLQFSYQV